jgi:peptidoglycan/xylan/chitin deacetylase (PgdA/CDA1 family)
MKKYIAGLVIALLVVGAVPVQGAPADTGHLVVLMYHRFDAGGVISTPFSDFKRQMEYLQSEDYHFVTLDEVRRHLKEGRPFPAKSVLVTIDDGYESTYTHAFPYLKKNDIPWVLYVYTEAIEKGYGSSLNWNQIKEMAESGVPVENHSYSHTHPPRKEFKSGNWYRREIQSPEDLLEERLNQPNRSYALPYGEYDTEIIQALKERKGYRVVWGIDPGVVHPEDPAPILPRFGINGSTTWEQFKQKLNRLPLSVETITPAPGEQLSAGDTIRIQPKHPDRYRQGPINVFLSEKGALDWQWSEDGSSIIVRIDGAMKDP